MGVIKGQNLRLTLGGKFIAFATSCTVHVSTDLEESSTKDSTNNFREQQPTGIGWDLSVDALYSVDTDATGLNAVDALDIILAQEKVGVTFEQTSGDKNRQTTAGNVQYSGYAWVNDVSVNAPNRQNANYRLQAQGDGQLTKGTTASSSDI